ncbi:PREDICTED: protein CREG1-like [Branchiostoma belcheri]|uniref:Protein CREG1-like n=1 Tax=Branchiostoma belcheri TaxID=7741 RepID=A0A6P4YNG8_BRABE|nr:PREDICTED: protein CREG1-like [Branchiostoma belcheri]
MYAVILTVVAAMLSGGLAGSDPPPHGDYAAMARYVVHNNDWGSLASISTHQPMKGKPFTNVFSVSDGPVENGTGVPYFFFSPLDVTVQDLMVNPNASFSMSEIESGYCTSMKWDAEDPRCAKIILSGKIVTVPQDEADFAKNALFSRHPIMADWIKMESHKFYFTKMEIEDVFVLDFFGGGNIVSPEDYFNVKP